MKTFLYFLSGANQIWNGDRITIEANHLLDPLSNAVRLAQQRLQDSKGVEIPQSGNDKKKLNALYRALGVKSSSPTPVLDSLSAYLNQLKTSGVEEIASALGAWNDGYERDAQIAQIDPIEIFRAERYEYGRSQGYAGKRDKRITLGPHSTMLGLTGYILSKQKSKIMINKGKREFWTSIVIPNDPRLRSRTLDATLYEAHLRGMNDIYSGGIPGVANNEALSLWLGWLWRKSAELPEEFANVTIYLIQEPGGNKPAYVRAEHSLNVSQFAKIAKHIEDSPSEASARNYQNLLKEALVSKSPEQNFASKVCRLAYLAIVGTVEPEELVYVASRESVVGLAAHAKIPRMRKVAGKVALDISSAIEDAKRTG
jgi:hypothetical protein